MLSDSEGFSYGIYESLNLGVPVIVTDLPVLDEIGVNKDNGFILEFDMSNLDVAEIYRKAGKFKFDYKQKPDIWGDLLTNKKSTYKEEKNMKCKVRATSKYQMTNTSDTELTEVEMKRCVPVKGREWITAKDRAEMLENRGYVTIIENIEEKELKVEPLKEEKKEETIKEPKKSTKRTSKKSKAGEK